MINSVSTRRSWSDRWLVGVCGLVAAAAVLLAIRDQRLVLFDDAAITFRYAQRIASGEGFTYNPGDRTNGASAPLYTLLLALGHRLGADIEAFARVIGVAVVVAYLIVDRRPPWGTGWTALAVATPWFLFSTLYFGSPVPHSATQKVGNEALVNTANSYDRTWVLGQLVQDRMRLLVLVAALTCALVGFLAIRRSELVDRPTSLVMLIAGGWFALHLAAFSLVDLGDAYSWYTTVLFPPLVLTAVLGIFLPWGSIVPAPVRRPAFGAVAAVVIVLALVRWHGEGIRQTAMVVRSGHDVTDFDLFEQTRQEAGRLVGQRAEPGDVLTTCFGWPAYEAPQTTIDELCPLSTREDVDDPTWWVLSEIEGRDDFEEPFGADRIVGFESPTATSYVYRIGT